MGPRTRSTCHLFPFVVGWLGGLVLPARVNTAGADTKTTQAIDTLDNELHKRVRDMARVMWGSFYHWTFLLVDCKHQISWHNLLPSTGARITSAAKSLGCLKIDPVQQFLVIRMRANEEPQNNISPPSSDGPVVVRDPNRPEVRMRREFLESQAGMVRICREQLERGSGLLMDGRRQQGKVTAKVSARARGHNRSGSSSSLKPASCSAQALSASLDSFSGDLANN